MGAVGHDSLFSTKGYVPVVVLAPLRFAIWEMLQLGDLKPHSH